MAILAKNSRDVNEFLASIEDKQKREDTAALINIFTGLLNKKPVMWGSIIGFGDYHYKYATGREGDTFLAGLSPRKNNITLYLNCDFDAAPDILEGLGKYKKGKGCIYINKLSDINISVLKNIIIQSVNSLLQRE